MSILTLKGYLLEQYYNQKMNGYDVETIFKMNRKRIHYWTKKGVIRSGQSFELLIINASLSIMFEHYRA